MRKLFLFVFTALIYVACGQSQQSGNAAVSTDALAVKEPCAVIFRPAGDKLQSLKSAFGDKSFPGIFQFNNSTLAADSQLLASKGIKIITTSATQLQFVRKNGESLYINLNHAKYAWEIFLFNGFSDPVKADIADIEAALNEAGIK